MPGYVTWTLLLQLATWLLTQGYAHKGGEESWTLQSNGCFEPENPQKNPNVKEPLYWLHEQFLFRVSLFSLAVWRVFKRTIGSIINWQKKCLKPLVLSACIDSFNSQMSVFGNLPVVRSEEYWCVMNKLHPLVIVLGTELNYMFQLAFLSQTSSPNEACVIWLWKSSLTQNRVK